MQPHTILWDEAIRGFCARRQFSGVITFSVVYRTQDGIARWQKIGRYGVFTPEQARQEAARILREVALGADPSALRHERRHGMTVAAALRRVRRRGWMRGASTERKPSTVKSDKSRIATHIRAQARKAKGRFGNERSGRGFHALAVARKRAAGHRIARSHFLVCGQKRAAPRQPCFLRLKSQKTRSASGDCPKLNTRSYGARYRLKRTSRLTFSCF